MLAYLTCPPAFWILILSSYTEGLCSVVSGIGMQELSSFCRHKTAYWKKQKPWTCTQLGWYFQLYIKGFFINVQVSNFLYNKFIDLIDRNETLFEGDRGGSLGHGRGSWYVYFKISLLENPLAPIYLAVSKPSNEHCFINYHHYCSCCSILPRWFSENSIKLINFFFFFTFLHSCKNKKNKSLLN